MTEVVPNCFKLLVSNFHSHADWHSAASILLRDSCEIFFVYPMLRERWRGSCLIKCLRRPSSMFRSSTFSGGNDVSTLSCGEFSRSRKMCKRMTWKRFTFSGTWGRRSSSHVPVATRRVYCCYWRQRRLKQLTPARNLIHTYVVKRRGKRGAPHWHRQVKNWYWSWNWSKQGESFGVLTFLYFALNLDLHHFSKTDLGPTFGSSFLPVQLWTDDG